MREGTVINMDIFEKFALLTEEEKLLVLKEVERLYAENDSSS